MSLNRMNGAHIHKSYLPDFLVVVVVFVVVAKSHYESRLTSPHLPLSLLLVDFLTITQNQQQQQKLLNKESNYIRRQ